MEELKLFSAKIATWGMPITIRAFDKADAEGLTRALFKVSTDVNVTITEGIEGGSGIITQRSMMKAEIEALPVENRGIDITSETEEEKQHLESLWARSAAAGVLSRNDNGSVTLTIVPTKEEN